LPLARVIASSAGEGAEQADATVLSVRCRWKRALQQYKEARHLQGNVIKY
jgi:hypothetical protein